MTSGSLTTSTLRGVSWTWAGSMTTLVLQLLYTGVMGRLLEPEAFGLVAAAMVGLRFVTYFSKFGIGSAVVQRDVLEPADRRVAVTLSMLLAAAGAVAALLVAPVVASLVDQPDATPVIRWLALGLLLSGVATVPEALLRRAMRFRAMAIAGVLSFVVGYPLVGIGTALAGWEVWSLVAATLTQSAVMALLVVLLARPSWMPSLDRRRAGLLLRFGGVVSVTGFLEFIGSSVGTIAVGRWVGAAALGQYSRATYLVGLPVEQLSTAATKVLMPSLSQVQHDHERFTRGLLASMSLLTCLVIVPISVGSAAAPALVGLVLGSGWEMAASVLPLVGGAYGLALLTHLPAVAMEAKGAVAWKLAIQASTLLVLGSGTAAVVVTGPTMHRLAFVWLVSEGVRHLLYWLAMHRVLHLELAAVARRYGYAGLLAACSAGPLLVVVRVLDLPPSSALAVGSVIGAAITGVVYLRSGDAVARLDIERLRRLRTTGTD